jgi:dTMP kinase
MNRRGIFVTFEGSEGCGKSTQIRLLTTALEAAGRRVAVTREPGGTPVGEQIRHTLKHAVDSADMTPEAELLLFAASRAQLVREVILPALNSGIDVLSDRFLDSTTVYQGVARKIPLRDVQAINQFAIDGCLPDLTFILDLPASEARARALQRTLPAGQIDRFEQEPAAFYEKLRAGYLELATSDPSRFVVLDASESREHLAREISIRVLSLAPLQHNPKSKIQNPK